MRLPCCGEKRRKRFPCELASWLVRNAPLLLGFSFICASSPQVIFEAKVSEERQGYIALDDIVLLNYPCCKYLSRATFSVAADL